MRIPIKEIEIEVNKYYESKEGEIFTNTRERNVVERRYVFYYLAITHTAESLGFIGAFAGQYRGKNYDHATVFHGSNKIGDLMCYDKKIKRDIEKITDNLRSNENTIYTDNEIVFKSELDDFDERLKFLENRASKEMDVNFKVV